MQTFLPFQSFADSAAVLDGKRLNKQIVECWQIYQALTVPGYGWQHHPAVKMWRNHDYELLLYGDAMYLEWLHRKQEQDAMHKSGEMIAAILDARTLYRDINFPSWLGDEAFHSSHRAALLYKLPEHYSQFGWAEKPATPDEKGRLPYVWPVK